MAVEVSPLTSFGRGTGCDSDFDGEYSSSKEIKSFLMFNCIPQISWR